MKHSIVGFVSLVVLLAGCTTSTENPLQVADDSQGSDEASARSLRLFEAPTGTALRFTLIDSLSTEVNGAGDPFEATLTDALVIDGQTVIPKSAMARGRVLAAEQSGRVSGRARIELLITSVQAGGEMIQIRSEPLIIEADATKSEDATKIGVGAGIGAGIGAALGGGKGAAVGAAIGGGSGTAVVLATRGDQIELSPETRLEFKLAEPLRISL